MSTSIHVYLGYETADVRLAAERSGSTQIALFPEAGYHPRAHVEIMEALWRHAKEHGAQLTIATHSDVLVLHLRTLVAERVIPHSAVTLHWIDRTIGAVGDKPFGMNERGVPEWWPTGVFNEAQVAFARMRRSISAHHDSGATDEVLKP